MSLATKLAQIPNITTNYIPRATATGFVNGVVYDDGNNIGIGTTSITNGTTFGGGGQYNKLKISSVNYPALEINSSDGGGGSLQFTYGANLPNQVGGLIAYNYGSGSVKDFVLSNVLSGSMIFATNNTEKLRITSAGSLLINRTTNPYESTYKFIIKNTTDQNLGFGLQEGELSIEAFNDAINSPRALRLYANKFSMLGGNVGIGTSSPNDKLTIKGQLGIERSVNSDTSTISNEGGNFYINAASGYNTVFQLGGTERMRITSGGLVGIGTSAPLTSLNSTLTVIGTGIFQTTSVGSYNENLRLNRNSNNGYAALVIGSAFNSTSSTGTGQWALVATPSGYSYRFDFDFQGSTKSYIDSSTGSYTVLSDVNKKKDFEDSTIGLNAILGLKTTLYRMHDDNDSTKKQLGFIAQQVKDFIPQAYVETIDGFIGLQDRPIIAALVKGMQEQQEQINSLKAQLGAN